MMSTRFWMLHRARKTNSFTLTEADERQALRLMAETGWASQFDPDNARHRNLVLRIEKLRQGLGVQWVIKCKRERLTQDGKGRIRVPIEVGRFPDFPQPQEIESAVVGLWGGGRYEIWSSRPRKRWHSIDLPGDPLDPEKSSAAKRRGRGRPELSPELQQMIDEWLEKHPEVADLVMAASIAKKYGIPLSVITPKPGDIGEDIEDDPELNPWRRLTETLGEWAAPYRPCKARRASGRCCPGLGRTASCPRTLSGPD